jgi:SAM-dependent methyltransferase
MTGRQDAVTEHFDRYADWGDLYDPANPRSHGFLARRAAALALCGDLTGRLVLDLGCGTGVLFDEAGTSRAAAYLGIDAAPNMVEAARMNLRALGRPETFTAEVGDVTKLALPDASFDVVVGLGLLEYFDDPRAVVREAVRVAKPGALLVFSTPRRGSLNGAMIALSRPLRAVARALTGRRNERLHRDERSDAEFRALFESEGCKLVADRVYNKLLMPWPMTTLAPRLARRAAAWAERRRGLRFLATGSVAAFRTPARVEAVRSDR